MEIAMRDSRRVEIIEKLKLEMSILKDGGYGRSVRTPQVEPVYLRDTITCLNYGRQEEEREPCERCFLMDFVPPEAASRDLPCHHIPLNSAGDTVASLRNKGNREQLEQALLEWLDHTVRKLESEPDRS